MSEHPLTEILKTLPELPAPGPIRAATDEDIAGWLCGGREGGCEEWPECEYCRMVARIEQDRATIARKDEEILKAFTLGMEQSATAYRGACEQRDAANAEVRRLRNKCKAERRKAR